MRRVGARVEDVLGRYPTIGVDALVSKAVPVLVEHALDGMPLGLSGPLNVDAISFREPVVMDLKFGGLREPQALRLAGYALAWEAAYEVPVNLGCLVYARFGDGRWSVERRFFLLGERVRQAFLEQRDERQRLVFQELDPGLPAECPAFCPLWSACRGEYAPAVVDRRHGSLSTSMVSVAAATMRDQGTGEASSSSFEPSEDSWHPDDPFPLEELPREFSTKAEASATDGEDVGADPERDEEQSLGRALLHRALELAVGLVINRVGSWANRKAFRSGRPDAPVYRRSPRRSR